MQEHDSNTPSANILGTPISLLNTQELLSSIGELSRNEKPVLVLSGNVHGVNLAYEIPWLGEMYTHADLVRIDGSGIVLAGHLLGYSMPKRSTWADFMWDLSEYCQVQGLTMYFLGARKFIAKKAATHLMNRFPKLEIVGTHHGYFNKAPQSEENRAVIAGINALRPDLLIVGFGMPLQERWIRENISSIHASVIMTGGGVFDYISGELTRPPRFFRISGFEWLGRLLIEPRRLWKRYLIGNPKFLIRVLRDRLTSSSRFLDV